VFYNENKNMRWDPITEYITEPLDDEESLPIDLTDILNDF